MEQHPHPPAEVPLSQAPQHQDVVVSRFELPPPDELRVKVMGICVGRPLHIVRAGEPLIVNVSGARIVMSRALADSIFVDPVLPARGAAGAVS